jgi:uncharacterized protein YjaZ
MGESGQTSAGRGGQEAAAELLGVPPLAGYALGYRVVQQYIRRTGKTVPEATFVPAREIIGESNFFV